MSTDEPGGSASRPPGPRLADDDLALHIEGLLEGDALARVERALARDPALRERREALAALLPASGALPPVAVPDGLVEVVLSRLEAEGLVELEGGAPEAAVVGDVLARLEVEGLVEPAPADAPDLVRAPAPGRLVRALPLLTLVVGLALGALLTWSARPTARSSPALPAPSAPSAASPAWLERLAHGLVLALDAAGDAAAAGSSARREAEDQRDLALASRRDALADLERARADLERARADLGRDREALAAREAALHDALAARDAARAAERDALVRRDEALARIARAPEGGASTLPASLSVADARGVARWDAPAAAWRPVEAGARLSPGAIVRGDGPASGLVVEGTRYALRDGVFVVAGASRLEPVPDPREARAGAPRAEPDDVPALIARFAGGGPSARADAQRRLTAAWRELGDPGAGPFGQLANDPRAREGVPPTTARGWEEWWARVRAAR